MRHSDPGQFPLASERDRMRKGKREGEGERLVKNDTLTGARGMRRDGRKDRKERTNSHFNSFLNTLFSAVRDNL